MAERLAHEVLKDLGDLAARDRKRKRASVPRKRKVRELTRASDSRPAGPAERCFYCNARVGDQHSVGCVMRTRTVVISATIEYTVTVPDDWDVDQITFHRNEGSWCASNIIAELEVVDSPEHCLCERAKIAYVREATEEDEQLGVAGKASVPNAEAQAANDDMRRQLRGLPEQDPS